MNLEKKYCWEKSEYLQCITKQARVTDLVILDIIYKEKEIFCVYWTVLMYSYP